MLTMRTPATFGVPDSPSSKTKQNKPNKKAFTLPFSLGLSARCQATAPSTCRPGRPTHPTPMITGGWLPPSLAFLSGQQKKKTKQKNCPEQVLARKQRSKETAPKRGGGGRGSQERLEPTLFLVGCGFRTLIAPQQDRIRDSHIKTP